RMARVLANVGASVADRSGAPTLLVGTGKDEVHLLVVMTAERGRGGGSNAIVPRLARQDAGRLVASGKSVKILAVGRKGADALRREWGRNILERIDLKGIRQLGLANAQAIASRILALFESGEFDVCTLYFSEFRSVIVQKPTGLQLIPVQSPDAEAPAKPQATYEYEPGEEELLQPLIDHKSATQTFRGLLENGASEKGARMSAMDNPTRKAGNMIKKPTTRYNRQRQANITKELIEIISGAEAL